MDYRDLQSTIKDNIRKIISTRFPNKKSFAERVGIDKTTVYQAVDRPSKRHFTLPHLFRISQKLDIPVYNLLAEEPLAPVSRVDDMTRRVLDYSDRFEMVPEIEPVACGNLANLAGKHIIGYRVFGKDLLKTTFKPFITRASGDSMHPTISEGDIILFDRNPDKLINPRDRSIYLVNTTPFGEEISLTIKRALIKSRDLWLFPDNNQYRAEAIEMAERSSPLQYILGIAIWIGKELVNTSRP
jgi:SOS-response transcriptional repressor LexA